MFHRLSRTAIVTGLLLALAITAGAIWLLMRLADPAPTAFGWRGELVGVAGNGERGHVDGTGAAARFRDPFALAMDAKGTLYVADAGRIRRIDSEGRTDTLPGQFETASGLALDKAGNIIVAETGANRIRKISADGVVTTIAGDGTAGYRDGPANFARFDGPMGVGVDHDGTIYVADSYNDRIRIIDANGQVKTLAGGGAPGFRDGVGGGAAFHTPSGIILDRNGMLIVADTGNDAIRRVDRHGRVSTMALTMADDRDGMLKAPVGLAQSWDGFVYISSYRSGRIVQMSPQRDVRILTGRDAATPGNENVRLASPAGLALDRDGALYVAEASKYAVRKLRPRTDKADADGDELQAGIPSITRAANVPWPVAPQQGWHEIVGDLGEVRGDYQGESRHHLHAGLDIRAGVGETVLAIADETITDPLPNGAIEWLSEGLRIDALTYIHMRVGRTATGAPIDPARFRFVHDAAGKLASVRIKRGTRFRVGEPLGTVNRMAHVHLELGPPGGKVNAMALRFRGFTDRFAPRIESVTIQDAGERPLTERHEGRLIVPAKGGPLNIVVDAWDQVDGNAPYRRLGLYKAGFQILHADGSAVPGFERPKINLLFDRTPLDADAVKIAYASSSGVAVHSGQPTRFLYVVTNQVSGGRAEAGGWDPAGLKPGNYLIRIFAADHAGNIAQSGRDLPVMVR